jgi:hypothetical protein
MYLDQLENAFLEMKRINKIDTNCLVEINIVDVKILLILRLRIVI